MVAVTVEVVIVFVVVDVVCIVVAVMVSDVDVLILGALFGIGKAVLLSKVFEIFYVLLLSIFVLLNCLMFS